MLEDLIVDIRIIAFYTFWQNSFFSTAFYNRENPIYSSYRTCHALMFIFFSSEIFLCYEWSSTAIHSFQTVRTSDKRSSMVHLFQRCLIICFYFLYLMIRGTEIHQYILLAMVLLCIYLRRVLTSICFVECSVIWSIFRSFLFIHCLG